MNNILNDVCIKYKSELINYKYCEYDNIINIPLGSHIKYFSTKNMVKKNGFLKDIKDISILELININKKTKWYIYTNQYYIFYKIPGGTKLKDALQYLVDNNFSIKEQKIM
jgi:hypothetical protein